METARKMTTTFGEPSARYFAHSSGTSETKIWQPLSHHLKGTGHRGSNFLAHIGLGEVARTAGLLHDLGKYSQEFQDRLAGGRRCDHASAGAKVAIDRFGESLGKILAFCIAGHHAGLANGVNGDRISSLEDRLLKDVPQLDPV